MQTSRLERRRLMIRSAYDNSARRPVESAVTKRLGP